MASLIWSAEDASTQPGRVEVGIPGGQPQRSRVRSNQLLLRPQGSAQAATMDTPTNLDPLRTGRRATLDSAPSPQLPPCAHEGDAALVDRAVVEIKAILDKTLARGIDEVGQYLLREFFYDDPSLYSSTNHSKHLSLRLLEERCESLELPVRRTFLGNALQLAVFTRRLPANAAFLQLPPSHRIELLRLRSEQKVEQFACKAVVANMTVRRIRDAVRKEREKSKSSRGRRPTPTAIQALTTCVRALRDERTGRLSVRRSHIDQLGPQELLMARQMAEALVSRLGDVLKLLGSKEK